MFDEHLCIIKFNTPPHLYLRQGDQTLFPQYNPFQTAFPCSSEKIPPKNITICSRVTRLKT